MTFATQAIQKPIIRAGCPWSFTCLVHAYAEIKRGRPQLKPMPALFSIALRKRIEMGCLHAWWTILAIFGMPVHAKQASILVQGLVSLAAWH